MKNYYYLTIAALPLMLTTQVEALEVDREVAPRITVGGRIIATVDSHDLDSDPAKEEGINLEDSSLLLRFDKRMYGDGVAGAVITLSDHEGDAAINQLHAFYWNRDFATTLGRTRLRNSLIEFPTIRDDDLLSYTHVGNGSSNAEGEQVYAEQFAFDWYLDDRNNSVGLWTGTRGGATAPTGFNSYGGGYRYEVAEDLRYVKWLRHAGVLVDSQQVNTVGGEETMTAAIAGAEFNLNMNPQANWSMAVQAIANGGIDGVTSVDIAHGNVDVVSNRARAASNSLVAAVRFTARPHLLTRWQSGLAVAWKDYSDISDASQISIVPSVAYRLGQGVDLLAQARYTDYSDGLGGGSDTSVYAGISFGLETMFNDNIGERDSILNLEHGYIQ